MKNQITNLCIFFLIIFSVSIDAEPVKLIFDTDMGNDVDDALALAMLHSLESRGESELLAVTLTKDNDEVAPYVDAINTFYGRGEIPIGITNSGVTPEKSRFTGVTLDIDGGQFERKNWNHKFEGGGEMSLMKGDVFEKVGVNISTVSGKFDNDFKSEVKGTEEAPNYWASGISLVAHMQSPKVPAFHFNTRYIVTGDSWFGGGGDLTPTIKKSDEIEFFHKCMKEACDSADPNYYERYKKACDEYFYLPHRSEARGEGGIFIDHLKTDDWNKDFNFIKEVGLSTLKAITTIIRNLKDEEWTEQEKEQQLIKRGRYVEFNLLWDRGTAFGIKTGGNSDAILMSMPPTAKWD